MGMTESLVEWSEGGCGSNQYHAGEGLPDVVRSNGKRSLDIES